VVTWASTGGALRVYKDGALAYSNATPVQAGASLIGGGSLLLGQEQDTIGGGFETSQAYLGSLDELAVYPSVLTAAQVSAHRQAASGTGGGTTCSDIANATSTSYSPQLADEGATIRVRVTASNGGGTSSVASAAVGPVTGGSNTPPVPVINTPVSTLTWKAGDNVSFSGGATDAEDGTEPASRLSWSIVLGHCTTAGCHTHPLATRTGVASGTIAAPDHESPSYIQLTLTATDAAGATASVTRRIDPQTVNLTFQTNPAGLSLAVGSSQSAPGAFTQQWVVNSQVQLNAPTQQTLGGVSYTFTGWSDGGAATHTINAPAANRTYTASYSAAGCPGVPAGSPATCYPITLSSTDASNLTQAAAYFGFSSDEALAFGARVVRFIDAITTPSGLGIVSPAPTSSGPVTMSAVYTDPVEDAAMRALAARIGLDMTSFHVLAAYVAIFVWYVSVN
jgi:hypothetical protein